MVRYRSWQEELEEVQLKTKTAEQGTESAEGD